LRKISPGDFPKAIAGKIFSWRLEFVIEAAVGIEKVSKPQCDLNSPVFSEALGFHFLPPFEFDGIPFLT